MKKLLLTLTVLAAAAFAFTGCIKKDFENPPNVSGYDPMIPVTHTIAQLKAMNGLYGSGHDTMLITTDVVVSGIVSADDRSGNYYKQIVIQDSTGGIAVDIDNYSLFNDFPVGRKVYVMCKGLYLGYNGGTPELGGSISQQKSVNGILGGDVSKRIIKADVGHTVKDTIVSFAAVKAMTATSPLINRLVTISDSVEFVNPVGLTYTDPTATTNRYISTCAAGTNPPTITVRTSNYADFSALPLPTGRGTISGILTIYKTSSITSTLTPQIILRDTSDVRMYNSNRCGGIITPGTSPIITLDSLRKLYTGSNIKLGAYTIKGIVISDAANGNPTGANIVIQDGAKGMVVYYGATQTYSMGDSLTIDVTGDSLINYKGALELKVNGGGSATTRSPIGRIVTPQTLTIAQILANYSNYEWTLVKILNGTVAAGGTYSGSKTLTDGTGNITLYTATGASFAATAIPTGAHNFTGIISQFNTTRQLQIRNTTDVQ